MTFKDRIANYFIDNFEDLLKFDLKLARVLGAPAPHTLSSYAHLEKNLFWKLFRIVTDKLFSWLFHQEDHCKQDYERINGLQGTPE